MSKVGKLFAASALAFGSLFWAMPAQAAQAMNVEIVCENNGIQGAYVVGWDNSHSFFEGKGNIAALYCEGGFSPLGQGATYVSDNLSDESLRYYNGITPEPVIVEPAPEPEDTPTDSESVSPEVEPSPEPSPEPTPEQLPEPTPESSPEPTPSPSETTEPEPTETIQPEPQPESSPTPDPVPVVEEPVVVLPEPEPQPQPEIVETPDPDIVSTPEPQPEIIAPEPEVEIVPEEPSLSSPNLEPEPSVEEPVSPVEPVSEPVMPISIPEVPSLDELLNEEKISIEQAEVLQEMAFEILETAEKGSEEYEAALEALALAATADDIVLDEELAAIPVVGAIAESLVDLINFADNVGVDMAPETRERAEETVIAAVIVGQIAQVASIASISGGAYRRIT